MWELAFLFIILAGVSVAIEAIFMVVMLFKKRWLSALALSAIGIVTLFLCYMGLADLLRGFTGISGGGGGSREERALVLSLMAIGVQIVSLYYFFIVSARTYVSKTMNTDQTSRSSEE